MPPVGISVGPFSLKRVRISPFLFSQRKLRNVLYLPQLRDLPRNAGDYKALVFDFGFDLPNVPLGPLETGNVSLTLTRPFLAWGLTGLSSDTSNPYLGYLLQFFQNHQGKQIQLFNKHLPDGAIVGTGQLPFTLKEPHLFLDGDSIQCEVKNLVAAVNSTTSVQVVLHGVEL